MQLEEGVIPDRLDAVLVGPGLGNPSRWWNQWSEQLRTVAGLLVLDADGINALASSSEGWRWLLQRQGPTWLTPTLLSSRVYFLIVARVMRWRG